MHVVLLPGAGGSGWVWSRVVPLLEDAGHTAVAVDLPADDEDAGLPRYLEIAHAACAYAEEVLVVGQSLGGFTAAMLADHLVRAGTPPVGLAFVNAMVPLPGETPGEWWGNVDSETARLDAARAGGWTEEIDLEVYFLHDVDPAVAAEGESEQHEETEAAFVSPCAIATWPDVPTTVIAGADDRFFPLALQQRVARERLGVEPVVVPGGHLAALSEPEALAGVLLGLSR